MTANQEQGRALIEPAAVRPGGREPLAIVGIGCRFPGGVSNPEEYWQLLLHGVDAITDVPPDRWNAETYFDEDPAARGKTCQRWGGFVSQVDHFDPQAFGISPREAASIDPQQRLLLEVAWEALDDAGLTQGSAAGSRTGVFIGISGIDYAVLQTGRADPYDITTYTNIGSSQSIAANRISYTFDLRGPSLSVDTACSSSLVALHLGCESLWHGDSTTALVGGVNLLLTPEGYIGFSRMSMLSPDGRCHAFDASANGFVRSEGAGMLLLKPLSQAQADKDRIYAVIRGTAVNQDGRTPGMTVPSEAAQSALVSVACQSAGMEPSDIGYIEAHGTGTLVGDPIELRALGAVLGQHRTADQACWVGSCKTNVGHLEAASGMAGVIKVALLLQRRQIPRNLHFHMPNPEIDFTGLKLRVPTATQVWPPGDLRALAGINSFGFGGTNAHAVLEGLPLEAPLSEIERGIPPVELAIPLSARSPEALQAMARSWQQWLSASKSPVSLADLAYTAGERRTHSDWRNLVIARDRTELDQQLEQVAAGVTPAGTPSQRIAQQANHGVVFVCCGQGPQWWAMGRELLQGEPVFRKVIEECDALIRQWGDWSLLDELTATEISSRMENTAIAQPALFAIQIALAAVWQHWGVHPAALVGHSVGEVAAAYLAGVFSLSDALRVIFERGRCMELAPARGRMLAAAISPDEARPFIEQFPGAVHLAAVNSPSAVTLSGEAQPLEAILTELTARKVFCRMLKVNYAFHSSQMDPIHGELTSSLRSIDPQAARLPLVSTVTGKRSDGQELGPNYWWSNVRQSVLFADAIRTLLQDGYRTFIELGPHPVLLTSLNETAQAASIKIEALPSLRRHTGERQQMLKSLGQLYVHGATINWQGVNGTGGRLLRLPNYPWQRARHWRENRTSIASRLDGPGHRLLGRRLPNAQATWQGRLVLRELGFIRDHRVQGAAVLPATAYLEIALAAQRALFGPGHHVLENIRFDRPCVMADDRDVHFQTSWNAALRRLEIQARTPDTDHEWTLHASAGLRTQALQRGADAEPLDQIRQRCRTEVAGSDLYKTYRIRGLDFGPHFQGVQRLYLGDNEALGEVHLPTSVREDLTTFHWHPAALDVCLHVVGGLETDFPRTKQNLLLPVELAELRCFGRPEGILWSHARLIEQGDRGITADVDIYAADGHCVMQFRGLHCKQVAGGREAESRENLFYSTQWVFAGEAGGRRRVSSSPTAIADRIHPEVERDRSHLSELRGRYEQLDQHLASLCAGYIAQALQALGWQPAVGELMTAPDLQSRLGIQSSFTRLLTRYLQLLVDDGMLAREGTAYRYLQPARCDDPESAWRRLWIENSAFFAELTLLGRCGRALPELLRGDTSPQTVIFPDDRLTTAESLYHDSSSVWFYNRAARAAVSAWLAMQPRGSVVRILEIGAGTGGLSGHLLPVLPADRTEYVFSDLSSHFLHKAEEKFAAYPFLRFQRLDIERDPVEQGFAPHSFDIVIASQVLHATTDLQVTLNHVRQLLAPGGALMMVEIVKPSVWLELVFGLMDGWWRFQDTDIRPESPLLTTEGWLTQLQTAGFDDAREVTSAASESLGNALFLAREPNPDNGQAERPKDVHTPTTQRRWLVFADRQGVGEDLIRRWTDVGDDVWRVTYGKEFRKRAPGHYTINPAAVTDFQRLVTELMSDSGAPCGGVIHLWNLDAPSSEGLETAALNQWQTVGLHSVLQLVQALSVLPPGESVPRLRVVTRGVQCVDGDFGLVCMAAAPVLGLGRVIVNEAPQFRCQLIDLDSEASPDDVEGLWNELQREDDEDEIALRGAGRFLSRYRHATNPSSDFLNPTASNVAEAYRLELPANGSLDALQFQCVERHAPGPGEVEIEILAAGLNFSDVLKALSLYPGLPPGPVQLGAECSGRISAVGPAAGEWRVGDEVVAIAPFCFGSHAIARAELVIRKPKMTFEEAATLPIAYLTASYALESLGQLSAGERVLIHAATGGVGLAALQIARRLGAELFATAGSREKRDLLHSLGVKHVMDSRSLEFADDVLAATQGEGVDVILNSLAGEAITKGLSVLRPNGRFLEIGKRDIYQDTPIGLKPFRKELSFLSIDLDRMMRQRPAVLGALFRRLETEFAAGRLCPVPYRVLPATEIVNAFRYMQQGRHIGKVVVSMLDRPKQIAPRTDQPYRLRPDRSYLITGGLGGFGSTCARWMVERGARSLVLMGRRGAVTAEAQSLLEDLKSRGATVTVVAGDVSQPEDVARVFRLMDETLPELGGVLHAAMVLEDGLLTNLGPEQMTRVLAPKVAGAWNLHRATEHRTLDFFLLFSSLSSVIGHAGQGNYAAANAFLDQLAHYRQTRGLPATTINWGYLGDVGYLARHERLGERLESQGVRAIPVQEALQALEVVLQRQPTQFGALRMDWARWRQASALGQISRRFLDLSQESDATETAVASTACSVRQQLLNASVEQRQEVLVNILREKLARVLGAAIGQIGFDQPLLSLGIDSLMAVDIRNWIEQELRCSVPVVELMGSPGLMALTEQLLSQFTSEAAVSPAAVVAAGQAATTAVTPLTAVPKSNGQSLPTPDRVDQLNDDEVDRLLAELLPGDQRT